MKNYSIKKTYADALYWATSNQSKNKDYHITRTQEAVLRKLIHYSNSNEKITYSNNIISEHTFMGEETIRKSIPELNKKGYLSTACMRISDGGEIKTRRTIFIKWDFLKHVLGEVPKPEKATTDNSEAKEGHQPTIETVFASESEPSKKTIQNDLEGHEPIPELEITDEKLDWIRTEVKQPTLTKSDLQLLGQEELRRLFYGESGVWVINNDSMENHHRIKLIHRGGSLGKLYDNRKKNDYVSINVRDLHYYLEQYGKGFKDITPEMYMSVKIYGLPKTPLAV